MYTDDTILTFGKYKFMRLGNVPKEYLISLKNNGGSHIPELREYLNANYEAILQRVDKDIIAELPVCDKITFPNETEAKFKLRSIRSKNQKHQKPIRVYECHKCWGWHLTSKPKISV